MTRPDITQKLTELDLPNNSYVVVGSGTLAALGIRDTTDIDLVIPPEVYGKFKSAGWHEELGAAGNPILLHDVFDVGITWNDPGNQPNLAELLRKAIWIDGIPYANLACVLAWKQRVNRSKDVLDIELITAYLKNSSRTP